jgi:hypothetical protein
VLKAIANAWSWRRKLETGVAATLTDIAQAVGVTPPFAGPMLKLAYLAPAVSVKELAAAAELPWVEQEGVVLGPTSVGKCRDRCSI